MGKYDAQKLTASRLLAKFGAAITISNANDQSGGFDPETGEQITSTPSDDIACNGVMLGYKLNEIDGTTVLHGDAKIICDAPTKPNIDSVIDISGDIWRIVSVSVVQPDGDAIIYTLQVRS